jgi:protein TonB
MALADELRRYKRYPAGARAAGQAGTADVGVTVNAAGTVQSVRLVRSSGYTELDDSALDMMRNAAPRAAVPEALRGRAFEMTLGIEFSLDE